MTIQPRAFRHLDRTAVDLAPSVHRRRGVDAFYRRSADGTPSKVTIVIWRGGTVTVPVLRSWVVSTQERHRLESIANELRVPVAMLARIIREHSPKN